MFVSIVNDEIYVHEVCTERRLVLLFLTAHIFRQCL